MKALRWFLVGVLLVTSTEIMPHEADGGIFCHRLRARFRLRAWPRRYCPCPVRRPCSEPCVGKICLIMEANVYEDYCEYWASRCGGESGTAVDVCGKAQSCDDCENCEVDPDAEIWRHSYHKAPPVKVRNTGARTDHFVADAIADGFTDYFPDTPPSASSTCVTNYLWGKKVRFKLASDPNGTWRHARLVSYSVKVDSGAPDVRRLAYEVDPSGTYDGTVQRRVPPAHSNSRNVGRLTYGRLDYLLIPKR